MICFHLLQLHLIACYKHEYDENYNRSAIHTQFTTPIKRLHRRYRARLQNEYPSQHLQKGVDNSATIYMIKNLRHTQLPSIYMLIMMDHYFLYSSILHNNMNSLRSVG